jgi:hypothetical protein
VGLILLQHVSRPGPLHGCVLPRWQVATRFRTDPNVREAELAGAPAPRLCA